MNLTLRRLGVVLGVLILAGAFYFSGKLSEMKEPPSRKPIVKQDKMVDIIRVQNGVVPTTLEVQGELVAFDKIDIFAEVSGTLTETSRPFKVGSFFPKGSVLIRVDEEETSLNLLSQKSSLLNSITQMMPDLKIDYPKSFEHWVAYLKAFDPEKPIVDFPEPLNDQEKYFVISKNLYSQFYNIKSLEERLSKYTIHTPFSGVITEASINAGAVVRSGQKLGELMNTGNYELEVTVPLGDLKYIKPGNKVTLYSDDIDGEWEGKIKRIHDQVDGGTQTVKVFIYVSGKQLREGMYLRGQVNASSIKQVVEIPRKLLINQNSVYVFRDSILQLQLVEVVKMTPKSAIVRGLEDGTSLLKDIIPGLFDGVKVKARPASVTTTPAQTSAATPIGSLD